MVSSWDVNQIVLYFEERHTQSPIRSVSNRLLLNNSISKLAKRLLKREKLDNQLIERGIKLYYQQNDLYEMKCTSEVLNNLVCIGDCNDNNAIVSHIIEPSFNQSISICDMIIEMNDVSVINWNNQKILNLIYNQTKKNQTINVLFKRVPKDALYNLLRKYGNSLDDHKITMGDDNRDSNIDNVDISDEYAVGVLMGYLKTKYYLLNTFYQWLNDNNLIINNVSDRSMFDMCDDIMIYLLLFLSNDDMSIYGSLIRVNKRWNLMIKDTNYEVYNYQPNISQYLIKSKQLLINLFKQKKLKNIDFKDVCGIWKQGEIQSINKYNIKLLSISDSKEEIEHTISFDNLPFGQYSIFAKFETLSIRPCTLLRSNLTKFYYPKDNIPIYNYISQKRMKMIDLNLTNFQCSKLNNALSSKCMNIINNNEWINAILTGISDNNYVKLLIPKSIIMADNGYGILVKMISNDNSSFIEFNMHLDHLFSRIKPIGSHTSFEDHKTILKYFNIFNKMWDYYKFDICEQWKNIKNEDSSFEVESYDYNHKLTKTMIKYNKSKQTFVMSIDNEIYRISDFTLPGVISNSKISKKTHINLLKSKFNQAYYYGTSKNTHRLFVDIKPICIILALNNNNNNNNNDNKMNIFKILEYNTINKRDWKLGVLIDFPKYVNYSHFENYLSNVTGQCKVRIDITDECESLWIDKFGRNVNSMINVLIKLNLKYESFFYDNNRVYFDYYVHLDNSMIVQPPGSKSIEYQRTLGRSIR